MSMTFKSNRRLWIIVSLIALLGIGYVSLTLLSHTSIEPMSPPRDPSLNVNLPPTTSHLSLSVTSSRDSIKALLESAVQKSIKIDDTHDGKTHGTLNRGEIPVTIDVPGKHVNLSTSLSGKIQVERKIVFVDASVGIETKGTVAATVSPVVAKDWSVDPGLALSIKLDKATTKLLGQDIDITGLVEGAIQGDIEKAKKDVHDKVTTALHVQGDILRIWNDINCVRQLSKNPSVWLRLTPKKATFGQLEFKLEALEAGLALEVESHLFLQQNPPEILKAPLPELSLAPTLPGEFHLAIPIEVSYEIINQQLAAELVKKPISIEGKVSVAITGASVQPYGDGVVLTVRFHGKGGLMRSASGTLYVTGIPVYDAEKTEIGFKDLKYTAKTEDLLLKSADWLGHAKLLDALKSVAVIHLREEIGRIKNEANKQLAGLKQPLPPEIIPTITIEDPTIERVVFAKDHAFAIVKVSGKLAARLQK